MRRPLASRLCLGAALVALASSLSAQDAPSSRRPAPGRAAIALTYDDALGSQLEVAIRQLDAAGLKGTFFLMGRQIGGNVPRWRAAAAGGHELGNHTVNHPCARGTYDMPAQYTSEAYTVDLLLTEITVMNGFLQALDGNASHAFAPPCGQNLAGGQDYFAPLQKARLASHVRDPRLSPAGVRYTSFTDAPGAEMIRWVEELRQAGAAGVVVFHGVGGDYLSVTAEAHQQLVTHLKAHEREIRTTTFSAVMDAASRAASRATDR
jgi:peptidoglycan/xylan/chitin deacetylase (PgdA/CDA1 family)